MRPAPLVATDRERVEGLRVIERQRATQRVPLRPDEDVPLTHVDELLLEDGQVVYQCVAVSSCFATYEKKLSARAHLTKHSTKKEAERLRRSAEAAAAAKSDAAQRAAVTRQANRDARRRAAESGDTAEKLAAELTDAVDELSATFADFTTLVLRLRQLRDRVNSLSTGADPELLEKARRYDAIRGAFND